MNTIPKRRQTILLNDHTTLPHRHIRPGLTLRCVALPDVCKHRAHDSRQRTHTRPGETHEPSLPRLYKTDAPSNFMITQLLPRWKCVVVSGRDCQWRVPPVTAPTALPSCVAQRDVVRDDGTGEISLPGNK